MPNPGIPELDTDMSKAFVMEAIRLLVDDGLAERCAGSIPAGQAERWRH